MVADVLVLPQDAGKGLVQIGNVDAVQLIALRVQLPPGNDLLVLVDLAGGRVGGGLDLRVARPRQGFGFGGGSGHDAHLAVDGDAADSIDSDVRVFFLVPIAP